MSQIGISFVFRASTAAFTRGVASANNSLKDLKKSLREFNVGNGFGQLVGVAGIVAGFRTAIRSAQDMRAEFEKMGKALPENIASLARYGDQIENLKRSTAELAATSLGYVTRFGEGLGSLINRLRGVTAEQEKLRESAAKGAEEQEKRRAEAIAKEPQRRESAQKRLDTAMGARATDKEKFDAISAEAAKVEQELKGVIPNSTRGIELMARRAELQNAFADMENKDAARGMAEAEAATKAAKQAADEAEGVKRQRLNKVGLTVEELAAQETGGFTDGNDPRLRARRALEMEGRARMLGERGDLSGALELQGKADAVRKSLEGVTATSQVLTPDSAKTAFQEALTKTNEELAAVKEALGGIIKAGK